MAARRRVTIKDVADAAGVSAQTVSRVLNERPDVSRDTYLRVRAIIADTGYAPNAFARGLTQSRSHLLGVVAYGLDYFGPSRVLTGIDRLAAELGYSISLNLIHDPQTDDVDPVISSLVGRQVDGIIWAIPPVGRNRAWTHSETLDVPIPVILVGGIDEASSLPSIGIDNREIGRSATEHLVLGGARRVGIVTGPLDWWEAQQRKAGWADALAQHGLPADDAQMVEGDWTAESGRLALEALVGRSTGIDAVFASNDQMALGVLHAAHVRGLRVPGDLSVVGVDNIAESSHFWPPLTTVHQPLQDAGALAVEAIDLAIHRTTSTPRLSGDVLPLGTLLRPQLIVRESSRRVAASGGG